MLFYGISLIMKEKSNASALLAAGGSTTRGRESRELRPRADNKVYFAWFLSPGDNLYREDVQDRILNIGSSVLAAEICAGPHNRLLRRQHCSSLCSQSEGHEHVANMTNALGHDFVGFSVLVRHNIRPPHFASKVSYSASPQASAKCSRDAPCSDAALACSASRSSPFHKRA